MSFPSFKISPRERDNRCYCEGAFKPCILVRNALKRGSAIIISILTVMTEKSDKVGISGNNFRAIWHEDLTELLVDGAVHQITSKQIFDNSYMLPMLPILLAPST